MPAHTRCPRCHKIGLVRFETVIRAGVVQRNYYCGACNHSWTVTDDGTEARNPDSPPDRPRFDR